MVLESYTVIYTVNNIHNNKVILHSPCKVLFSNISKSFKIQNSRNETAVCKWLTFLFIKEWHIV